MAKNEVSIFDSNQVPDHIRKFNETVETNITGSMRSDTLTYKGKVWTVSVGGDKQVLMKTNNEGDEEPRQIIPVVILGYAKRRSRAMYEGGFTDNAPKAPVCWSADGIKPDDAVEEKQNDKCATCPMAAKGSKVSEDGKETKACQEHKFVAVQLYKKWDMPPLRLRLAITSLYDAKGKEQQAKGYYAFDQYCDMLRARNVKHTAEVVTYLKFDPTTAYPKVLFRSAAWMADEEELNLVTEIAHSDIVGTLTNPVFDPAGDVEAGTAKPAKGKPTPKEDPEEDEPELTPAPVGRVKGAKQTIAEATKPAAGKSKPKVVEPEEDPLEGEVVNEGGEAATDVTDIVEGAEDDDEDAALAEAEAKAKALRDKLAAKKKTETDKAAAAAKSRKAAVEPEDEEAQETIKVAPAKPGKAATAAPKANGAASAGKPAAPKGTPAGKPSTVSKEVADTIDDW